MISRGLGGTAAWQGAGPLARFSVGASNKQEMTSLIVYSFPLVDVQEIFVTALAVGGVVWW